MTIVAALIGGLSGGLLAPWAKAYFDRNATRHQAFDRTITAVKIVLYESTAPVHVDPAMLGGGEQAREFNERLPVQRVERFLDATYEMRKAIAELEPHYKVQWDPDRYQLTEDELTRLVDQLERAR
ncbi:hypothetical protein GTU99_10910 [Streptomyces sp. PRKS01-65]|nr:hypothetical protein [Streptomyces harenosi]NEY32695.1 hypothetical protein [Streptomyces harenosi]